MAINNGDLVITLPKIKEIQSIVNLEVGQMGFVVEIEHGTQSTVYGVIIDGKKYYLFDDEIKKVEETC
jgi:hypothetical protein